ncbi:MAG: S1/P1 Nuclease [bacterium ADurb.Bin429]|nr:MAG: S1/P1 Nuclease [bacterium ADurb.Bin429]
MLLVGAVSALAWNEPTHMVTADIAYSTLRAENPAALARVGRLLMRHPEYENWVKALPAELTPEERNRRLLMVAATWPDKLKYDNALKRKYAAYNHPEWHYINYPYTPGQPPAWTAPSPNILDGYKAELRILASNGNVARRAIALCWVLHLTGDAHCPMHAVALITGDYPAPAGDKGGNSFYVRTKAENKTARKLHEIWDNLITGSDRFQNVRKHADRVCALHPRASLPEAKELRLEEVLRSETYPAAVHHAYLDGALRGGTRERDAPALPADYLDNAERAAEKLAALAGYRIAGVLASALR